MDITANWIWKDGLSGTEYNSFIIFKRDFRLEELPQNAKIAVTADSRYRLKVNGQWCADGPARAYFNHYSYDVIDASTLLRAGLNRIECEVRFFGCGTFHQTPQRGGFLFQLDADGKTVLVSDDSWEAAVSPQWVSNTPKQAPQMAPWELFDASVTDAPQWGKCYVISDVHNAPWQNLYPRETPMLTREEALLKRVVVCRAVEKEYDTISLYPRRMRFQKNFSINNQDVVPLVFALEVNSPEVQKITPRCINLELTVNGTAPDEDGSFLLRKGKNTFVCAMRVFCGHDPNSMLAWSKSCALEITSAKYVIFDDICSLSADVPLHPWANKEFQAKEKEYQKIKDTIFKFKDFSEFISAYPDAEDFSEGILTEGAGAVSAHHMEILDTPVKVENPQHIIYPDDRVCIVHPADGCDVQLLCDLGTQSVGYWNFVLNAPAGTIVDLAGFEYLTPEGILQAPGERYLNSMRYICKEGLNRYTSAMRRGGRYVTITLRNMTSPVEFRSFRMVESTYPTVFDGEFKCSDIRLEKIYNISARTLKLCMEDTFTDCPLYEQTFWVGDARNESIFAMNSCGAYDIVRHCIRLTAESLGHLPLIGCQVPSGWSVQIPAFGYMWVMSIEDYYRETADIDFIREMYPAVKELIDRSFKLCDNEIGLLRTYDWNFIDWSNMDSNHPYMLYNSFMFAGALRCASRLAELIGKTEESGKLTSDAERISQTLAKYWNERKQAFPEALEEDGTPDENYSIHTSLLALLFEAVKPSCEAAVKTNILGERNDLLPVGSPFFTYYLHELYERLGAWEQSYSKICRDYLKMLEFDATTVWETFAEANYDHTHTNSAFFPTRSNCHAWSSIPLELFPRLLLGIRRAADGCREFTISPYTADLDFASGARTTPWGKVEVKWQADRQNNRLNIICRHPQEIKCSFVPNVSTDDFDVEFTDVIC